MLNVPQPAEHTPEPGEHAEILEMFEGLSAEAADDLTDEVIRAIVDGVDPWKMSAEEATKFIKKLVLALVEHKARPEIELQKEPK